MKEDWASPPQTLTQTGIRFFMKTLYCAADQIVKDGEKHIYNEQFVFQALL